MKRPALHAYDRLSVILVIFIGLICLGCLWDEDTLAMERRAFPNIYELISGQFLRHSPEFHYWRIQDRQKAIAESPDSSQLYDDLVVSLTKLNRNKEAIEILLRQVNNAPNRYETRANLGTAYLHDGQWEEGIAQIEKAIEINPNAHFGREVYQKYLAEYVVSKMEKGRVTLPLNKLSDKDDPYFSHEYVANSFYAFLVTKLHDEQDPEREHPVLDSAEVKQAIQGIEGMMRFGNYESPILLEALGDLLMEAVYTDHASRHLATRAYLKASYHAPPDARAQYIGKARYALRMQVDGRRNELIINDIRVVLDKEIAAGDSLYQSIRSNEISWIYKRIDPSIMYHRTYFEEPGIQGEKYSNPKHGKRREEVQDEMSDVEKNIRNSVKDNYAVPSSPVVSFIDSVYTGGGRFVEPAERNSISTGSQKDTEAGIVPELKSDRYAIWIIIISGILLGGIVIFFRSR